MVVCRTIAPSGPTVVPVTVMVYDFVVVDADVPVRTRSPQPVENGNQIPAKRTSKRSRNDFAFTSGKMPARSSASTTEDRAFHFAAVFGVAIVIVTAVEGLPGTTLPGLNEAVARSGRPEAARVTGAVRLPFVFTTKEKLAESPELIACVVALLGAIVKSTGPLGDVFTMNNIAADRLS